MPIQIVEAGVEALAEFATISPAFEVRSRYRVEQADRGLGGLRLVEEPVDQPSIKDYDSGGELPTDWRGMFDLSSWALLLARDDTRPVGGLVIAYSAQGMPMFGLEARAELAAVWDIRIDREYRRRGIGSELFRMAATWARERECTQLAVETQNINMPACRFYASQGCHLGQVSLHGYEGTSGQGEVMLVWYLDL